MSIRKAARQVMAVILPWTPRQQRKDAIASARAERKASQVRLERAIAVKGDIGRLVYDDNHFAQRIIETLQDRPRQPRRNGQ